MPDCDPALSGAAIRRCEFQKALCLRRIVAAFIAITVAISVTTTPPVPAAAITLATTFSVAGLHIRSRDDTFCRYRTGTLRTVASTAPTTSPAASVSATARPTASPAAAMTGKSGGVIFRACTYGFRQGQFRNLPLDKLLDTVEFTLLLLVHERNGPPRSAGPRRAADAMDIIFGIVRHVIIDDPCRYPRCRYRVRRCPSLRESSLLLFLKSSITCSRFS